MMRSTQVIIVGGIGLVLFNMLRRNGGGGNGNPMSTPTQEDPLPSQLSEVYSVAGYDKAVVFEYQYSVGNPPQYDSTYVIGDKKGQGFLYDSSQSNIMVNGKTGSAFTYINAVNQLEKMSTPSTNPTGPQKPEPQSPPVPPTTPKPDFGLGSGARPMQGW